MAEISGCMGPAAFDEFDSTLALRRKLLHAYEEGLTHIPGLRFVGGGYTDREHAAWLCTAIVEKRFELQTKLREQKIESNQVHYRNDRYSIFGGRRSNLPNMDEIEEKYLVLPLHTKMTIADVERVCSVVRSRW